MEILEKAERLKSELDALRPLDPEAESRIMQKFRLDWNYHSNNIEGNSLTYGETKALILFGITSRSKPFKDYAEMKGHNEAINWVLSLVKGDSELTEVFIRQLHTLLFEESVWKEAVTEDGVPIERKIEIGKYKTLPNHVRTITGETFYFATPEETPAKMQELVDWFRTERMGPNINPIVLAALFHYRLIRIHPFDDGNGRVSRILMNFILMQFGYPPAIIKTEDKQNYFAALRLADAGELDPFVEYIGENLVRSLEIMMRGARGESIDEPDDLDKELTLLEKKIRNAGRKIELPRSKEAILNVYDESVTPMITRFLDMCRKFDKFYVDSDFTIYIDSGGANKSNEDAVSSARTHILSNAHGAGQIGLRYYYSVFNQEGLGDERFESMINIKFEITKYRVSSEMENDPTRRKDAIVYEKLYSETLTDKEIDALVNLKAQDHKNYIEKKYEDWELAT